jgi:hypothetical protein
MLMVVRGSQLGKWPAALFRTLAPFPAAKGATFAACAAWSVPVRRAVREITVSVVASVALAGCGSVGKFDSNPSHTIDLSGSWTVDHAASDDPHPILEKLRPKQLNDRFEMPPDDGSGTDDGQTGPQQGSRRGGGQQRRGSQQQMPTVRNNNDAFTHGSVIKALRADLARAESVTIRQSPDRFSLDYGVMVRSFTPGTVSVVGADWGVADQSSGWKGKDFVIQVKPQTGVADIEKYTLSDDGKHLIEQLRLGGGEFPVVQLKRVYVHTDKPLPRAALPSND